MKESSKCVIPITQLKADLKLIMQLSHVSTGIPVHALLQPNGKLQCSLYKTN